MSETKMTPFEWQQTLPAVYGQEFDIFECVCEGSSMWVKAVVFTTSLTCPSERYLMMESLGGVTGCAHWNQELEYGKFEVFHTLRGTGCSFDPVPELSVGGVRVDRYEVGLWDDIIGDKVTDVAIRFLYINVYYK